MDTPPEHPSPETIGPYRILGLLGQGGMGAVYLAERGDLERRVALKTLHPGAVANRKLRARLKREAKALSLIHHPNVVRLLDADLGGEIPYLAMEYVEGRSLEAKIGPGRDPWSRDQVIRMATDVAKGLAALHRHGVVHRDIKPANVMETPGGDFVITDFGLAGGERFTRMTLQGDILGTPAYLSPEAWKGEELKPAADVYQWSVLVFEAWSARSPYGEAPATLARRFLQAGPGDRPAEVLADLVVRGMEADPGARPQDAPTLVEALEAAAMPLPGLAPESGPRPGEPGPSKSSDPVPGSPAAPDLSGRELAVSRSAASATRRRARGKRRNPTAWLLPFLVLVLVSAFLPWPASTPVGASGPVAVEPHHRSLGVTWTSPSPAPDELELLPVDPDSAAGWRVRGEGPPRTRHRLRFPMPLDGPHRLAIGGVPIDPGEGPGTLPHGPDRDPTSFRSPTFSPRPDGSVQLAFTTPVPARGELRAEGQVLAREEDFGLQHALRIPGTAALGGRASPTLILETRDGELAEVELPGGIPSRSDLLVGIVTGLTRDVTRLVAERFPDLDASSPDLEGLRKALEASGDLARFEAVKPMIAAEFQERAGPIAARIRLYEALEDLDLLDHLRSLGGEAAPLFGVAPLYRPMVAPRLFPRDTPWDQTFEVFDPPAWCWIGTAGRPRTAREQAFLDLGGAAFLALRRETESRYGPFLPEPVEHATVLVQPRRAPDGPVALAVHLPELPFQGLPLVAEVEGRIRLRLVRGFMLQEPISTGEVDGPGWRLASEVLGPAPWRIRLSARRIPGTFGASIWVLHQLRLAFEAPLRTGDPATARGAP